MLTPLAVLYLLGFPVVGALGGAVALLASGQPAPSGGAPVRGPRSRVLVLLGIPTTLVVFGLLLFLLSSDPAMEAAPPGLAEAGARAYGVPALLTGFAMAIIFWRGGPAVRASPEGFGRIMVMVVLPETAAIFGLLIAIQIYGQAIDSGIPAGLVDASGRASL